MGTPLEDEAARMQATGRIPVKRDWIANRERSLMMHWPSIKNVVGAMKRMASLVLDGRIDTDLWVKHSGDLSQAKPTLPKGRYPAIYKFNVVPTAKVMNTGRSQANYSQNGPEEGLSWHPNVALQVSLALDDTYRRVGGELQPTGNLELQAHFRSWGKLTREEMDRISQIHGSSIDHRDQGWDTAGTNVVLYRKAGDPITPEEAETILAALSSHVIDHRKLHRRAPMDAARAVRGNFSSSQAKNTSSSADVVLEITQKKLGITGK